MELANDPLIGCFTMLRIIIIRVCVKVFVMARFNWLFSLLMSKENSTIMLLLKTCIVVDVGQQQKMALS